MVFATYFLSLFFVFSYALMDAISVVPECEQDDICQCKYTKDDTGVLSVGCEKNPHNKSKRACAQPEKTKKGYECKSLACEEKNPKDCRCKLSKSKEVICHKLKKHVTCEGVHTKDKSGDALMICKKSKVCKKFSALCSPGQCCESLICTDDPLGDFRCLLF